MDFDYSPEQQLLRESVASLGKRYGHAYYVEKAKTGGHTDELWAEAAKLGYLGVSVPTEYGGGGGGITEVALVARETQLQLYLADVRVPAEALVGGSAEAGLPALFSGLNPERITVAAMSIGTARYALGRASSYVAGRAVWGRSIGSHQGVAHPLAHAHIQTELAGLMVAKAAALYDAGRD